MKKLLFCCLLLVVFCNSYSQQAISVNTDRFYVRYFQNDRQLSISQITNIVSINERSSVLLSKAKNLSIANNIISLAGGFCLGYSIASFFFSPPKETTWVLFGAGAVLTASAVVIDVNVRHKIKNAVLLYNEGLEVPQLQNSSFIKIGCIDNGVGFAFVF